MVFLIILMVTAIAAGVFVTIRFGYSKGTLLFGIAAMMAMFLIILGADAKVKKSLIRAHLDNPNNYTYSQLAEHNELVTELSAWQGTIFSFYNDIDLQTIDIDNVGQKVIIDSKKGE